MKRIKLTAFVILAAAGVLLASCDNPVDLKKELGIQLMKDQGKYLEVLAIDAPVIDGTVSPTVTIEIKFDRPIDFATVTNETLQIKDKTGTSIAYPAKGLSYVESSRTVRVRVYPYLPVNEDIQVSVGNVKGTDNSDMNGTRTGNFKTSNILAGSVMSLTGSDPSSRAGYTKTASIDFRLQVNDFFRYFRYRISVDGGATWKGPFPATYIDRQTLSDGVYTKTGFPLSDLGITADSTVPMRFQFLGDADGSGDPTDGTDEDLSIIYDSLPPPPASLPDLSTDDDTGISNTDNLTNMTTVTLAGSSEALSIVDLYDGGVLCASTNADAAGAWSAELALADGTHSLTALASDQAGNLAPYSPALTVTADSIPPAAPTLAGTTSPTLDNTPTWSWTTGGGGNGTYEYKIGSSGAAAATTGTSYTPASALTDASYIFYVREGDNAGNTSIWSLKTIAVSFMIPINNSSRVSKTPLLAIRAPGFGYSYTFWMGISPKTADLVNVYTGTSASFQIPLEPGLSAPTTYYWRVTVTGERMAYPSLTGCYSFTTGR